MSGYFASGRAAIRLARDHHERAAFWALYIEAEAWTPTDEWCGASEREWSEPFECRDTDLMEWGGWESKRGARSWLDRVVRAGLVEVTSTGGPRTPRLVRVRKPHPKADRYVNHLQNRSADRNKDEQTPDIDESGPLHGPQPEPHSVKTRDPETDVRRQSAEAEDHDPSLAVWSHWQSLEAPGEGQVHASSRKLREADRRLVRARLAEDGLETVQLVLTWAHTAPDSWWREKGALGLDTLTRAKGWSTRVEQAQAWDRAGRPTHAPRSGGYIPQRLMEWADAE